MLPHQSPTDGVVKSMGGGALLWLLGAAAALAISIFCVMAGSNGKISALALISFVWTVASLVGALEHLPRRRAHRLRHDATT